MMRAAAGIVRALVPRTLDDWLVVVPFTLVFGGLLGFAFWMFTTS